MIDHLGEHMEATKVLAGRQQRPRAAEKGYVSSYNPDEGTVKVFFPHDLAAGAKVARGPYQLVTPWVGNGGGMMAGPVGGDLDGQGNPTGEPCMVIFYDDEGEMGDCIVGSFNSKFRPPAVPGGEVWMVHKGGATLKLRNDGGAQITGAPVELGAAGINSQANGVVRFADLDALVQKFNAHTHPAPMGPTSAPVVPHTTTASGTVYAKS